MQVQAKWDAASLQNLKKLAGLKKVMRDAATAACHEAAAEYKKEVTGMIVNQTGNWTPLSPVWSKKKEVFNLDPRILIATGTYVESFALDLAPKRGSVTNDHWELGRWIEYGTDGLPNTNAQKGPGRMPARPHLMPALEHTKQTIPPDVMEKVSIAFSRT